MPQRSKLIRSRDDWKTKAVSRANELRYRRKAEKAASWKDRGIGAAG
jgi:hypothetical protein